MHTSIPPTIFSVNFIFLLNASRRMTYGVAGWPIFSFLWSWKCFQDIWKQTEKYNLSNMFRVCSFNNCKPIPWKTPLKGSLYLVPLHVLIQGNTNVFTNSNLKQKRCYWHYAAIDQTYSMQCYVLTAIQTASHWLLGKIESD